MRYARIGLLSFGGPAEQIAVMHRILVKEQHWIGEERFLPALNYCRLLPGPKAQQSAHLVGWLLQRTLGMVVAGALSVLPGFLAMLCVSVTYVLACDVRRCRSCSTGSTGTSAGEDRLRRQASATQRAVE